MNLSITQFCPCSFFFTQRFFFFSSAPHLCSLVKRNRKASGNGGGSNERTSDSSENQVEVEVEREGSPDDFEEFRPRAKRNRASETTTLAPQNSNQSLIDIIKGNGKQIPQLVKIWVERYEKDPKPAMVELLTMLFEACGAKYCIKKEVLDETDVDDVVVALVNLARKVEAPKKKPGKSLYAKATDTGVNAIEAAKRLKMDWDSAAEIEDADTSDERDVPSILMKLQGNKDGRKGRLAIATEIFEVAPSLHMVELHKSGGDTLEFHKFYKNLSTGLKDIVWKTIDDEKEEGKSGKTGASSSSKA